MKLTPSNCTLIESSFLASSGQAVYKVTSAQANCKHANLTCSPEVSRLLWFCITHWGKEIWCTLLQIYVINEQGVTFPDIYSRPLLFIIHRRLTGPTSLSSVQGLSVCSRSTAGRACITATSSSYSCAICSSSSGWSISPSRWGSVHSPEPSPLTTGPRGNLKISHHALFSLPFSGPYGASLTRCIIITVVVFNFIANNNNS